MFRIIGIPILATLGLLFAIIMMVVSLKKPPVPPIAYPPPHPPFLHYVAGSGIIEASSLNINLGPAVEGIVEELYVQAGDFVKKGDPLFRTDPRRLLAEEKEALATKSVAIATLDRLMKEPRAETVPPLEARVKQTKMRLSDEFTQFTLFQNVSDKRAISFNEFNQRKYAAQIAKYEYEQAKADLDLLKAGAWIEDIKIANQQIEEADARINVVKTNLERTIVRAPMDGQILQVKLNVGQFAQAAFLTEVLVLFGKVDPLHVRIDVDEEDAWRVFPGACAMAYVRGNRDIKFPLQFVRIEPYVVPKRSLTGENLERVDTRVLQLIYRFDRKDIPVFVGQLLDIYIEAKPSQGL